MEMSSPVAELVRLVDRLEDASDTYVTLAEVEAAYGGSVEAYVVDNVLLVDYRTRADGAAVTLCRLNRRHPLVAQLTASW